MRRDVITFLLLFTSATLFAQNVNIGDLWYSIDEETKTAKVVMSIEDDSQQTENYSYLQGDVTIPSSIKYDGHEFIVTSIGDRAFSYAQNIKSVFLPSTIESYGSRAFQGCPNLKSITIPPSVTGFGQWAFEDCPSFDQIHISDLNKWMGLWFWWNTENPLYYAHNLYLNDKLVTDIVVPKEVKEIGSFNFCGCRSLNTVTINQYVNIENGAFYDCGCKIYIYGDATFGARSLTGSKEHKNTVWTWREFVSQMEYEMEEALDLDDPLIYCKGFEHLYMFDTPIYTTGPTTIRLDSIDIKYCDMKINDFWVEKDSYLDEGHGRIFLTCSPGKENILEYYFTNPCGETIYGSYAVTTPTLEFQKTKVTMVEKDVVLAETPSNIWDEQSKRNIQHEIVPVDSDLVSRMITAGAICDGIILTRTKLYYSTEQQPLKIRPFYTDKNGNSFYGEWVEFDPTQYQYNVNATVYTSPYSETGISQVSLKGYCFAGTMPITEYGFMLTEIATGNVSYNPFDGDGIYQNIMNMTIDSLNEGEYHYCAYAKTKDDIVYGETYNFYIRETTHIHTSPKTSNSSFPQSSGIYTIQGIKIANHWEQGMNLPNGIYIVNGKKMVVNK